jgi:putative transposase
VSIFIHKAHNVTVMLYHVVCVAKYRRAVLTEPVDTRLKAICLAIAHRYQIHFLEIGTDKDHVHFLIQSVPTMLPQRIVQIINSITARELFKQMPELRHNLWGSSFWTKGYFMSTVGRTGSENAVRRYVQSQGRGKEYIQIHKGQLMLFDH